MLITGYHDESWDVIRRGEVDGLPMCEVRRVRKSHLGRATVFRLVKRPNGWYNVGQYLTIPGRPGGYRPSPEPKGVKLSGSRIDLTLLSFAQEGHANVYA